MINVVVVFNSNISVFVIALHVCSSIECLHFALIVSETSTDSIIQNEVVSKSVSKTIIKLILHCTHCDKNYHDKNHCEILHSKLKQKRLANRRNRSDNDNDSDNNNINDNDNSRRNRDNDNDNNNDNNNNDNNNDNRVAKRNDFDNVKEFDFFKTFIAVNLDFLKKRVNMIIIEKEIQDVVNMIVENIFFEIA